jgi:Barstar (barnase inhibitor)
MFQYASVRPSVARIVQRLESMIVSLAEIDCANITDWQSFHEEFAKVFGFPAFYGRNMDAWIDCMTSLDEPEHGLSSIHCDPGKVIPIELENVGDLKTRCPEQFLAILECSAFVNWGRIKMRLRPVLALSFHV